MRIGGVVFDPATGEAHGVGRAVRLEPQPAAVLTLLASRAGELVSHDELRREVWGETTHVNFQQSLHYCIRQIRVALGDTDRASPLIETIPRRGYRLRASVEGQPAAGPVRPETAGRSLPGDRTTADRDRVRTAVGWPAWVTVAVATVVLVAYVERRPNDHHGMAVAVLQTVHDLVY